MPAFRLVDAKLPEFGIPETRPEIDRSVYAARLGALNRSRRAAGLDALVIYADREHTANLTWLTGFDPRFEEALLVISPDATPTLLVGPENLSRAEAAGIDVEARLYPPFGLLGQDRSKTPALAEVLRNAGSTPTIASACSAGNTLDRTRQPSRRSGWKRRPTSSIRCATSSVPTAAW